MATETRATRLDWDTFVDAWRQGDWLIEICSNCGCASAQPRSGCPNCGGMESALDKAYGPGEVLTWTRVHHPFYKRPAGPPPYVVAAVALDAYPGTRFIGELIDKPTIALRCGTRVELRPHSGPDGIRRPAFIPIER